MSGRNWEGKTDEELVKYAKDNSLYGLAPCEVEKKDRGFYDVAWRRELIHKIFKRKTNDWKSMSDEELIQYAKDNKLYELSPSEGARRDSKFYYTVQRRELVDDIFLRKRKIRIDWKSMSDKAFIKYAKDNGFYELSPSEVRERDSGFYNAVLKRELTDEIFVSKFTLRRSWKDMSDDDLVQYAKENKLYGLKPFECEKRDERFYHIIWERGLIDRIFVKKGSVLDQLERVIEEEPAAKEVAALAAFGDYAGSVADILIQEWPDRFPSAADLARSLPGMVKGMGHSITPFTMDKARKIIERTRTRSQKTIYALDDLLYGIAVDKYQQSFNKNPRKTLNELRGFARQKNGVKKLAQKVLDYYQEVFNFGIPGHGSLKKTG